MTRQELFAFHKVLTNKASELMVFKNQDYAPNDTNPFSNFDRKGLEGITTRMGDKLARLEAFAQRGEFRLESETVEDTVLDMINYAILYAAYLHHKKSSK